MVFTAMPAFDTACGLLRANGWGKAPATGKPVFCGPACLRYGLRPVQGERVGGGAGHWKARVLRACLPSRRLFGRWKKARRPAGKRLAVQPNYQKTPFVLSRPEAVSKDSSAACKPLLIAILHHPLRYNLSEHKYPHPTPSSPSI